MRVVLAGPPEARARLRQALAGHGIDIVGEAPTLGAARPAAIAAGASILTEADHVEPPDAAGSRRDIRDAPPESLTQREHQVLELLAEGLPNKAIATRLAISDQTVKFHVASICGKLGAANRTDAVRRAVRTGILTL